MPDASKSPQTLMLFPEKLFYKIGEVSRIVGVEPFVLRYWETEFPFLSPRKSKSGQRLYTKKEIDLILQVQQLLYVERYTIDGVRKKMSTAIQKQTHDAPPEDHTAGTAQARVIRDLVTERLRSMLKLLT